VNVREAELAEALRDVLFGVLVGLGPGDATPVLDSLIA